MNSSGIARRRALALSGIAWIGSSTATGAQWQRSASSSENTSSDDTKSERRPLPPNSTTRHTLELPGRTLRFGATAGAIRLSEAKTSPHVELAFVAFQLEGTEKSRRPITFAFNGGPGFASAWLNVGAVGPWRIPLGGDAMAPSASPEPTPNVETWLDFTDLVFIDPAGTGYSRILTDNDSARRRLWSVDGDIEYLATAIRHWLDRFERNVSPKYLLGESYGGFRAPRLARELATNQGTGVSGLALISPLLDFGGRSTAFDPLYFVTRLPSMAATMRAEQGAVTRAQLADVENYATTDFLLDLIRGERDADAVTRRSARVAEIVGLDPALVRHYHGLIDSDLFLREFYRARARVGSIYDATVTSIDPFPLETRASYPDPVLEALKAPLSSAMVEVFETKLNWRPDVVYRLGNSELNRQWNWGGNIWSPPQALEALLTALSLDRHLSVLIAHGLFDLITPYFATQMLLDQTPAPVIAGRVDLSVYPGGHMFYTNDTSRGLLREEAAKRFGWR